MYPEGCLRSHERPGISPVVVARRRKQGLSKQPDGPTPECRAFVALQESRDGVRDRLDDHLAARQHLGRQLLAGEVPHHGAELSVNVEAQAVVDSPDPSLPVDDEMAPLAVAVVRQEIERRYPPKLSIVEGLVQQREVVLGEVRVDETLRRPLAVRPLQAQHRLGHDAQGERRGKLVGSDLTAEQATRVVPQRALAPPGLVDGTLLNPSEPDRREKRVVRAPRQPAQHFELSFGEKLEPGRSAQVSGGRWPFVLGHTWPLGSSGYPQSGQGGRPASTSSVPRMASPAACSRVIASRTLSPVSASGSNSSARPNSASTSASVSVRSISSATRMMRSRSSS